MNFIPVLNYPAFFLYYENLFDVIVFILITHMYFVFTEPIVLL